MNDLELYLIIILRGSTAINMDVDRLKKDELEYELEIRGIKDLTSVDEMRKALRRWLHLEKMGKLSPLKLEGLDGQVEVQKCKQKITEVNELISNFRGERLDSMWRKIDTKLMHLLNRIERISGDATVKSEKSELLKDVLKSMEELESKDPSRKSEEEDDSYKEDEDAEDGDRGCASQSITMKQVPVAKWSVKFSGNPKELSVRAFVERVEELLLARGVSKTHLFNSAMEMNSTASLQFEYFAFICPSLSSSFSSLLISLSVWSFSISGPSDIHIGPGICTKPAVLDEVLERILLVRPGCPADWRLSGAVSSDWNRRAD